jgi:methionyl-tRNA formyltransferase
MSKKIVFMGTPEFSVQSLEVLVKSSFEVLCVYTQPPKKSSRGQKLNSTPVQKMSEKLNLMIRTPKDLNDEVEYKFFKSLSPDIVVVVAYGNIIPKKYLDLSKKGFINIHASLLPKWRGAAPIQRSIMNLDKETGISIMKIKEKLDSGPFMRQVVVPIDKETNTLTLSKQLSKIGSENIIECLNLISNKKAKYIEQDHSKATYAKKINKAEAKIFWTDSAKIIISKINALNPSPGAWFDFEGVRYKIWKANISGMTGRPGEILTDKLMIACKDQSIEVLEIQKEGRNKMPIKDFLIGSKVSKGKLIA